MKPNEVMHFAFNQDRRFCENYRAKDMDKKDCSATASYPRVVMPGHVSKRRYKNSKTIADDVARKETILDYLSKYRSPYAQEDPSDLEMDMREINQVEKTMAQRQKAMKRAAISPCRVPRQDSSVGLVYQTLPHLRTKNSASSENLTLYWNIIHDE